MKIDQLVTSLDLSRKLKELGVKQESLFSWCSDADDNWYIYDSSLIASEIEDGYCYSAYLASELSEIMPDRLVKKDKGGYYWISYIHDEYGWRYSYGDIETHRLMSLSPRSEVRADTEAEARGLMVEYLIEEGLLKI